MKFRLSLSLLAIFLIAKGLGWCASLTFIVKDSDQKHETVKAEAAFPVRLTLHPHGNYALSKGETLVGCKLEQKGSVLRCRDKREFTVQSVDFVDVIPPGPEVFPVTIYKPQ